MKYQFDTNKGLRMLEHVFNNSVFLDIECSGNDPNYYSIISLGAVYKDCEFYVEFKPDHSAWDPKSGAVHKLKQCDLIANGEDYKIGFNKFYRWVKESAGFEKFGWYSKHIIPAVFCYPYDMIWLDLYFRRYTGMNPFRNHFRCLRTIRTLLEDKLFPAGLPKDGRSKLYGVVYDHNALNDAKFQKRELEIYLDKLK